MPPCLVSLIKSSTFIQLWQWIHTFHNWLNRKIFWKSNTNYCNWNWRNTVLSHCYSQKKWCSCTWVTKPESHLHVSCYLPLFLSYSFLSQIKINKLGVHDPSSVNQGEKQMARETISRLAVGFIIFMMNRSDTCSRQSPSTQDYLFYNYVKMLAVRLNSRRNRTWETVGMSLLTQPLSFAEFLRVILSQNLCTSKPLVKLNTKLTSEHSFTIFPLNQSKDSLYCISQSQEMVFYLCQGPMKLPYLVRKRKEVHFLAENSHI